jgi:sugar phosphate isomerase/epimerase
MIPTLNPATAGGGLSLPEQAALARRHGFAGLEFTVGAAAEIAGQGGFEAAAAIFDGNHVVPACFGLPTEWRKDEETFQHGLAALPVLADLAEKLGCRRCCTWVLPSAQGEAVEEYAARSLRRFCDIARVLSDAGVMFGLEFLGPQHFRTDPEKVWFYDIPGALNVVDTVSRTAQVVNVGLLVDCWHWYTSGGTTMDLASIPLEQIIHVHINDAPNLPVEEQRDQVRLLPGATGVIDIVGFLKTLAALGYDGPVAVETFSEELRALPPDEAAARAAEAVDYVFQAAEVRPFRVF